MNSAKDYLIKNKNVPFIVADTGPLIHLVGSGLIHEVSAICSSIVIPDLVAVEATIPGKLYADQIEELISNGCLLVSRTATGDMYRAALIGDPSFRAKDAGERAIIDWLLDTIDETPVPAIIIYENGKVPRLIEHHDMNANVSVMTTRMFAQVMLENGWSDIKWGDIVDRFPTINPKLSESHHYFMEP